MTDALRLSPRQALICIVRPSADPSFAQFVREIGDQITRDLLDAALRDTLTMMIRVDGASLTVVCPDSRVADELAMTLPAGMDLIAPNLPLDRHEQFEFGIRVHLERGFSRVVAVQADTLLSSPRALGTAFGVLESADAVLGPVPVGGLYLIGVRAERAETTLRYLFPSDTTGRSEDVRELLDHLGRAGLIARRIDSHDTIRSLGSLEDVKIIENHAINPTPYHLSHVISRYRTNNKLR